LAPSPADPEPPPDASAEEAATGSFVWRDAGRTVLFRVGGLGAATQLLAEHGFDHFELLSTERAMAEAPELAQAAAATHVVPPGPVPDAAASVLASVDALRLVALGGGRVIDTAKAIAAVTGASVAAIPTTLSGAEMTAIHRLPAGSEGRPLVRPELVIADPEAMTSLPEAQLRASAMNALAHGADSLYTPFTNPVSELTALHGAALIAAALDQRPQDRDRAALAVGSLLCGYAIDSALFALHHVVCQSLVRVLGIPHAETNAAILPRSMAAMRDRARASWAHWRRRSAPSRPASTRASSSSAGNRAASANWAPTRPRSTRPSMRSSPGLSSGTPRIRPAGTRSGG
jgi:Iron-containing alcohol dehydrogenase